MSPRLQRLREHMRAAHLDCLALVPGPNMAYLTGLHFHLMERPVIAFIPATGQPTLLAPGFEAIKAQSPTSPLAWRCFTYTDEQGPHAACAQACAALGLSGQRLAVEQLTMRVLELTMIQRDAPGVRVVPAEPLLAELRMRKDADELDAMRRAARVAEEALRRTLDEVRPGLTERQIAAALKINLLRAGSGVTPFEPLVQSGPNSASPHGTTTDRRLALGDILLIDFGARVNGYASDITRTFAVGDLDAELVRVHEIVRAANAAGRAAAGPGVPCQEVDRAARRVIEEAGYGEYFIHRTGHGLGLEGHEPPYIVAGETRRLEVGMTFTVEPGIYLPGRGGVRIEDDVVITEDGCESLTQFERGLQHIG